MVSHAKILEAVFDCGENMERAVALIELIQDKKLRDEAIKTTLNKLKVIHETIPVDASGQLPPLIQAASTHAALQPSSPIINPNQHN